MSPYHIFQTKHDLLWRHRPRAEDDCTTYLIQATMEQTYFILIVTYSNYSVSKKKFDLGFRLVLKCSEVSDQNSLERWPPLILNFPSRTCFQLDLKTMKVINSWYYNVRKYFDCLCTFICHGCIIPNKYILPHYSNQAENFTDDEKTTFSIFCTLFNTFFTTVSCPQPSLSPASQRSSHSLSSLCPAPVQPLSASVCWSPTCRTSR